MIENFVTIYHKTWIKRIFIELVSNREAERKLIQYDEVFKYFKIKFRDIYPESFLHVITDDSVDTRTTGEEFVVYHKQDISKQFIFENFHLKKFELYSMFDFPFMYIDFDIMFIKNFSKNHIETNNSFNVYRCWRNFDFTKISSVKIEDKFKDVPQFNNGIIWVPKKDKNLTKELIKIHQTIFKNKKKFTDHDCYHNNDEFALSYFIKDNNLKMKCFEEINKPRVQINKEDLKKYQTVHYWGHTKDDFVSDYKFIASENIAFF
jgi:hypothetical protein